MSAPQAPFSLRDIESAVEQGREAERERIITLLASFGSYEYDPRYLIAAIKGEG